MPPARYRRPHIQVRGKSLAGYGAGMEVGGVTGGDGMKVTFTKLPRRRYEMTVVREHGLELAPRGGPGYHDYVPHDALHFLVEAEAGLTGGVFGRIAAGTGTFFSAADPALLRKQVRREKARKLTSAQHADMARSEALAGTCQVLWEMRAGQLASVPEWFSRIEPETLESDLVRRIMERLDDFATRWHTLQAGGSVTLSWPLRVPASGTRRLRERPGPRRPGRRSPRG